jgi:general secretion pathway protein D
MGLELNYRSESIRKVVEDVARATGESFLFDDTLQGRITIMVPHRVSAPEALELLDTALLLRGYAAVPAIGGVRKIVKIEQGIAAAPLELRRLRDGSEGLVATVVPLSSVAAEQVVVDLKHLTSAADAVVAYAPTNSLIVAGSESRLLRLISMARVLDEAGEEDLLIRTLRHRSAQTIVEMLLDVFREKPRDRQLDVWADARLNAVIARSSPARLEEVRHFLDDIDRPQDAGGVLHVLRVLNRDAKSVAETLNRLASAAGTTARSRGGGAVAREVAGETLAGRIFNVVVDEATSSLVISADPDTFAVIRRVVDQLDRARHPIGVTVTLYQVITPASLDLGVDAFIPLGDSRLEAPLLFNPSPGGFPTGPGPGATTFARYARTPLVVPIVDQSGEPVAALEPQGTTVAVTADARQATSRVLERVHIVLVSGEEQEIFGGQNVPIPVAQAGAANALSGVQTRDVIERHDVGLKLRLRPVLGEQGDVRLDLDFERSAVSSSSEAGDPRLVGPTLLQQRLSSEMTLRQGEVGILGAALGRSKVTLEVGTPWLKDIPGLGWAFRWTSENWMDNHLLIVAEAEVLRSREEMVANSIRRRLAWERHQSRVSGLEEIPGAPYALRIDTRERQEDATAIAESLELNDLSVQMGRWKSPAGGERFDIYVTGFETIADAGAASLRLHRAGWKPQLVVLPVEAATKPSSSFPP